MIYRRIVFLIIAISLYTSTANAQDNAAAQWYQVEVLVFANNDPNAALDEQWPQELGLKYPANIVTLSEPLAAIIPDTLNDDPAAALDAETAAPTNIDPTPLKAFVKLPSEQRLLNKEVASVIGQYDFRPLFHQAWRQTINERDESLSIAINGGEAFDDHFELEGSIKISLERYLHIHTDLWLNRFVSNAGEQPLSWPLLPPVPRSVAEQSATDLVFAPVNPEPVAELDDFNAELELPPVTDPLTGANQFLAKQLAHLRDKQYRVDKTIVLRQHRRMRSAELHYIDHPLFGVLIRIDPYDPEALTENNSQ